MTYCDITPAGEPERPCPTCGTPIAAIRLNVATESVRVMGGGEQRTYDVTVTADTFALLPCGHAFDREMRPA